MQEAIRHGGRAVERPTLDEIEPAARELIEHHGPQILATARRYSLNAEDAEDAFQRGLEILLTKAPSTDQDDLVPWLKTVVKHEAFAIRKQRQRAELTGDRELSPGVAPPADHQAERHERLRVGAEAMSRLKPQEVRCLLLRAEGYSYKQICEETGFSYTKVNRCLAEGRKAFLERVAGIESGAECERLAPLLSKLADGETVAEDLAALRPHLRTCLACRARLREYRGAPNRVAALLPLAAGSHLFGRLLYRLQSLASRAHDQIAHAGDVAAAHKAAAVAAATAALAGGGVATVETFEHGGRPAHRSPAAVVRQHARKAGPQPLVAAKPAQARTVTTTRTTTASQVRPARKHATTTTARSVTASQQEFAPSPASARPPAARPARARGGGEFGP